MSDQLWVILAAPLASAVHEGPGAAVATPGVPVLVTPEHACGAAVDARTHEVGRPSVLPLSEHVQVQGPHRRLERAALRVAKAMEERVEVTVEPDIGGSEIRWRGQVLWTHETAG